MTLPMIAIGVTLAVIAAQRADAQLDAEDAQRLFYSSRYEEAAARVAGACDATGDLAACELRTSALLFQIKRAIGDAPDKDKAWKACSLCQHLMPLFLAEIAKGQATARARLRTDAGDMDALFLLGKLDLNYVWLQLGTLGKKTGWGEYWEARRSLDKVLKESPAHVRAKVARAWIDYIVDTRMPRGTKWLLGGGNKKRGLLAVREATTVPADFYAQTEAMFALWDMQVREKQWDDAVASARRLAQDFPDNADLRRFLAERDTNLQQ